MTDDFDGLDYEIDYEHQEAETGPLKQELLLSYLVGNPEAFSICKSIIDPTFFDKELRSTVEYLLEYSDKYREIPTLLQIRAETGVRLEHVHDAPTKTRWICDEMETHCRREKVIQAVYDASEKILSGEMDGIVDPIKNAVMLSLHRDMGLDIFKDPMETLKRMLKNDLCSTGFRDLDEVLYGGIGRGEITLFIAGSGVGKSQMLANVGVNFVEMEKNVLYITHELKQDMVAKRLYSMITGVHSTNSFKEMERISDIMRLKSRSYGKYQVKYLPSGSSINDIESYYNEFCVRTGVKPDLIAVDYLDLLHPKAKIKDLGNLWVKDKYVTEELRAFVMDQNLYCVTASQMTRGAMDTEEHTQSMIAGGISKINTVDNVISMYQSQQLREAGMYMLQMLKTRSSSGFGKKIHISFDPNTMRFFDSPEQSGDQKKTSESKRPVSTVNLDRINRLKNSIKR